MNSINVRGRLTRDAKVIETSNGLFVLKGTIADNYAYDDSADKVNWITFTRFMKKKPSDKYIERLIKGAFIVVDGRLESSTREVDGKTYHNLDVIVNTMDVPFSSTQTGSKPAPDPAPAESSASGSELPF